MSEYTHEHLRKTTTGHDIYRVKVEAGTLDSSFTTGPRVARTEDHSRYEARKQVRVTTLRTQPNQQRFKERNAGALEF